MADLTKISVNGTSYDVKDTTKIDLPSVSVPQNYVPKSNGDGTVTWGSAGGGSASSVTYDNTTSGLEATNVQDAIDEQSEKIVNLSNYSTTEHIVGKWIDGSDIWEKTIIKNTISYGGYDSTDCGIDAGSKIIYLDGYYYNDTNDYKYPLNYIEENYKLKTTIWQNPTMNRIASFLDSYYTIISGAYFTIRYIKPTT